MDIAGKVKEVRDAETYGTFTKRELWIETDLESKYPQTLSVEFVQDNVSKLDDIGAGDIVEIAINLRGRYHEGTDKVYNTLTGWKIAVNAKGAVGTAPPVEDHKEPDDEEIDDIPF